MSTPKEVVESILIIIGSLTAFGAAVSFIVMIVTACFKINDLHDHLEESEEEQEP